MLKRKLDKAGYDALSEGVKGEYKLVGSEYVLDLDDGGGDDLGALKRARDHEKEARQAAENELRTIKEKLAQIEQDKARASGDFASVEKSYKDKIATLEADIQRQKTDLETSISGYVVNAQATQLAAEISSSPALMRNVIEKRLKATFENGEVKVRVLDADGKPSSLTIKELSDELVANKDYSAIILQSRGSGGGAGQGSGSGSGAPGAKKFKDMTGKERTELYQNNRAEFDRLKAADDTEFQQSAQASVAKRRF